MGGAEGLRGASARKDSPARGPSFFFAGPLSHYFYLFLERAVPPDVPLAGILRLLLDRVLFAPAFLLLFFVVMNFLEVGLCHGTWDRSASQDPWPGACGWVRRVWQAHETRRAAPARAPR